MEQALQIVVDGLAFGECPRWHDGALWWSDMHDHRVMKRSASGEIKPCAGWKDCRRGLDGCPVAISWSSR